MRRIKSKIPLFFFLVSLPALSGCSTQIRGALREGGAADLNIRTSLEPQISVFIRNLSRFAGQQAGSEAPVLDGPLIGRSMAGAPGIGRVSFSNTASSAIEGTIAVFRIDEFLTVSGGRSWNFITLEESKPGGSPSGRLTVNLNFESAVEILPLLSEEIQNYLSAILAPVALGEKQSKADYLADVASFLGREQGPKIAAEIAASRIALSIDLPAPVAAVRGGTFSGTRAQFSIPLVDLLVMEAPLSYEVLW
jgi:hypothetical protein